MKKIKYLIPIYLLLGLFVSSIGMTWCHYQVTHDYSIKYFNKTAGQYEITDYSDAWDFDPSTQTYTNEFVVSNRNTYTNYLNIKLSTTQKATYSMVIIEPSGREVKYDSILIHDEALNYIYKFIDKDGNEVKLECQKNVLSKLDIRLEALNITDSFLTEVILEDASYDIQTNKQTTVGQYQDLIINSNYLSSSETFHVILEEETIELTLDSNMNVNTKIKTNDANALLNNKKELELAVNANEQVSVTLDTTNVVNNSVLVEWQILNNENNVIQTLKAEFILIQDSDTLLDIMPVVEMNYIDNKDSFNIYEPIQFTLKSDIDTTIQIGSTFPANTYYSYDGGENWYITTSEGALDISLISQNPAHVVIDLSKTDIEWEDILYEISSKLDDYLFEVLEFQMELVDIEVLEVSDVNMGIISSDDCTFTINTEDVTMSIEQYNDGKYTLLTDEYFTLESEDSLNYTLKQNDVEIPKGIYRIKIQQHYNKTLIKEVKLSFFTLKEVDA